MKNIAKIAVIGAVLALGATQTRAQTNVLVNVSIGITGVKQTNDTAIAKVHISSKDIIKSILPDATVRAKLLLEFPIPDGTPVFIIRDVIDHNNVDTLVDPGVLTTASVGTAVTTSKTAPSGVTNEKITEIRRFVFNSAIGTFDVQGYTTSTSDNRGRTRGELFDQNTPTQSTALVSGTGTDASANPAVLKGTISLGSRKIEGTEIP